MLPSSLDPPTTLYIQAYVATMGDPKPEIQGTVGAYHGGAWDQRNPETLTLGGFHFGKQSSQTLRMWRLGPWGEGGGAMRACDFGFRASCLGILGVG